MTFVAGQVLTAAQLNALDITSLTVDTDTLVVDATNDRVGINQASPSVALDVGGSVVIDDDLTVDTNTLKVDSTNNRVGIGTASPGAPLHLYASGNTVDQIRVSSTGGATSEYGFLAADASTNVIRYGYWTGSGFGNNHFEGNVGIGITSPQASLSFANSTGNKIDLFHSTGGSGDRYGFQIQPSELRIHSGAGGSGTGGITFGKSTTSTFTERMRITNDGNVGIGINSPAAPLHIRSSANEAFRIENNGGTSGRASIDLQTNGDDWEFGARGSGSGNAFYIYSVTNSAYRLYIDDTGDVGIGTSGPVEKFHVEGGGYYSNRSGFSPTVNDDAGIRVNGNWGGGVVLSENNNRVKLYAPSGNSFEIRVGATATTGGTLGFDIASNGQVSIPGTFPGVSGYLTVRRRSSDGLLGYASSSQRYKENIVDADDTWRQIYDLRPRDFDWRESMFGDDPDGVPTDRSDYGLIAEEANEVMPSIVQWSTPPPPSDDTDDAEPFVPVVEAIDYEKLSTYLLPAIQDLNARVATLESA